MGGRPERSFKVTVNLGHMERSSTLLPEASMGDERYQSFEEFWPYYLSEHRNPTSRRLHYIGTGSAVAILTVGLPILPLALPAAMVAGYGGAWVGHFLIEKNRPATFTYPGWSLRGDFRMLKLALQRKLADDPAFRSVVTEGNPPPAPGESRGSS